MPPEEAAAYVDPEVIPCFPRLSLPAPKHPGFEDMYRHLGAALTPDGSGKWVVPATPKVIKQVPAVTGIKLDPLDWAIFDPRLVFVTSRCWRCSRSFDFCQLAGAQVFDRFRDRSTGLNWAIARYVRKIEESAWEQFARAIGAEGYHKALSKTAGFEYYMNHCPHCGLHQGDHPLIEQPTGALHLTDPARLLSLPHIPLDAPVRFCGWLAHVADPMRFDPDLVAPPFGSFHKQLVNFCDRNDVPMLY